MIRIIRNSPKNQKDYFSLSKPTSCVNVLNTLYKIKYTANLIMNQMKDAQINVSPKLEM